MIGKVATSHHILKLGKRRKSFSITASKLLQIYNGTCMTITYEKLKQKEHRRSFFCKGKHKGNLSITIASINNTGYKRWPNLVFHPTLWSQHASPKIPLIIQIPTPTHPRVHMQQPAHLWFTMRNRHSATNHGFLSHRDYCCQIGRQKTYGGCV